MATHVLTNDNFRETYTNNDIVILDFWAVWCGPCKSFKPTYEAVSEKYPDLLFGTVETEVEQKLSAYFHIRSIPSIIIIREGLELFRHSGSLNEEQLCKVIEDVIALDMEEVKKEHDEAE